MRKQRYQSFFAAILAIALLLCPVTRVSAQDVTEPTVSVTEPAETIAPTEAPTEPPETIPEESAATTYTINTKSEVYSKEYLHQNGHHRHYSFQ